MKALYSNNPKQKIDFINFLYKKKKKWKKEIKKAPMEYKSLREFISTDLLGI